MYELSITMLHDRQFRLAVTFALALWRLSPQGLKSYECDESTRTVKMCFTDEQYVIPHDVLQNIFLRVGSDNISVRQMQSLILSEL